MTEIQTYFQDHEEVRLLHSSSLFDLEGQINIFLKNPGWKIIQVSYDHDSIEYPWLAILAKSRT